MSEMAFQYVLIVYTCKHKRIERTYCIESGTFHEEIPSCVEVGCSGYQMLREGEPNLNATCLVGSHNLNTYCDVVIRRVGE